MKLDGSSIDGDPKIEQLEAANQELREGLQACRELVAQYRSKLAANRNNPLLLNENEPDSGATHS